MPDSGLPRVQQNGPQQPPKIAKTGCASAEAQMVFLVARRRAMASGSPPAVHMMFTIVKHQWKYVAGTPDMTLEQIRTQFEKEYHVKVTEMGVCTAHAAGVGGGAEVSGAALVHGRPCRS
ncbi:hypothetical protein GGX14DRAFT_395415 [Mycena pura]|uniref:Uncharacterized protein n=1 Tax=Mycena pura TaxID=153505 RepID=A0AAD6YCP7_9AGAR|nr:hypothetical protein GGX14DRAFT_395415 [Mycena pura]